MNYQPKLTAATVIHHVVCDMLYQHEFDIVDFPEIVDLAVINTGLGILRSNFDFVKKTGSFWDSTHWTAVPRPFLDAQTLAYANAVAAWVRSDKNPAWASELPSELIRPMRKSLKYLFSTNDSFFDPATAGQSSLTQSQGEWLELAGQKSTSKQLVAIRHLQADEQLEDKQEILLLDKLRSPARTIVLHSISAVESLKLASKSIAEELRFLAEHRDDEIRAKAMITLTKLGQIDETTIGSAAKMIDGNARHVVFAGVFALSSLDSVPEDVLRVMERGFVRALQTCDYEFVGLFAAAFDKCLDNPDSRIKQLLQDEQPEYLQIAMEALQNVHEQSAAGS